MIFKSTENLKHILSTIKNSFLPAVFLLFCLLFFYGCAPYSGGTSQILHYSFLLVTALTFSLLYAANQAKPLFTLLTGTCCYIIINYLKTISPENFFATDEFRSMCFILPINLTILYFLPQSKLTSRKNMYLLLILLLEGALLQHFCQIVDIIPHLNITLESIPLWACAFWVFMLAPIAINISFKHTIINTGLFYADSSLFMGLIYSNSSAGITTFFLGFASILLCVTILDLYTRYHYDYLEHVGSKSSYLSHANSKFPFKYTIAIFSIDNRDKLMQFLGERKMRILEQMVINSIMQMPYELTIYRYNDAELIMVFKNEDAKHAKEFADNIRHNIAASEFIFANQKSLKITISVCVSEKTRKDLNASEVTERAHNALQKSYRFNCNITTTV